MHCHKRHSSLLSQQCATAALTLSSWINTHPKALVHRVAYIHFKCNFEGATQEEFYYDQFLAEHQKNKNGSYRLKTISLEDMTPSRAYRGDGNVFVDILRLPLLTYSPGTLTLLTDTISYYFDNLNDDFDFSPPSQIDEFGRIVYFIHFLLCK
jgi:hypothetical protein